MTAHLSTFSGKAVTLAIELRGPVSTPAVVTVLDDMLETVASVPAAVDETVHVPVAPGRYLIEARIPSGERVRRQVVVPDEDAVVLEFAPAQNEWMASLRATDRTLPAAPKRVFRRGSESADATPPVRFELASWVLDRDTKRWQKAARIPAEIIEDDQSFLFTVPPDGPRMQLLEVRRHPDGAGALVLLPTTRDDLSIYLHKRVASQSSSADTSRATAVRMTITRGKADARFDGLLSFFHQGDLQAVDRIANASAAEKRLEEQDPLGAALGAYVLLRLRARDQLHDLTANLCRRFPWLPDGKIIRACHLLQLETSSDEGRALVLALIEDAFALGPPVFAEGLRLLVDGLALVEELAPKRVRWLRHALHEPLMAWIRSRPLTTFDVRSFPADWDARLNGFDAWKLPRSFEGPAGFAPNS